MKNERGKKKKKEGMDVVEIQKELGYWKKEASKIKTRHQIAEKAIELIINQLPSLPKVRVSNYNKPKNIADLETVILLFSDVQGGELCREDEIGIPYNLTDMDKKMDDLFQTAILLVEMQRHSVPIDKLCIFMLGDIVEGTTIFSGQLMRAEPMAKQLLHLWQKISGFVLGMCQNFKEVEVYCVYGNHGRISKENLAWDNNDYILYKMLEEKTNHQPNLKWVIPTTKWQVVKVEGWKFLLTHGDEIRRHMQFPWYSQARTEGNYRKLLKVFGEDLDFFIHGHHHQPAQIDSFTGEIICNGTFAVGNRFVMNELVQWSRPTQKIFGVHKRTGITWSRNIRLDLDRTHL